MPRNFLLFAIALLFGSSCTVAAPQAPEPTSVPKVPISETVTPALAIAQLGQPIQIEVEDTRKDLNHPSPLGCRAWLQVVKD